MLSRLHDLATHCEIILQDQDMLTDEQQLFTQTILENIHRFQALLTPVIDALDNHQPGDPFPGDMHDIRTPLVSLIGYSDILSAGVVGDLAPAHQERFALILSESRLLRDEMEQVYQRVNIQLGE